MFLYSNIFGYLIIYISKCIFSLLWKVILVYMKPLVTKKPCFKRVFFLIFPYFFRAINILCIVIAKVLCSFCIFVDVYLYIFYSCRITASLKAHVKLFVDMRSCYCKRFVCSFTPSLSTSIGTSANLYNWP